jgi:dTDP-glucose 4,6-dehydratase/UDP-glucose 4-epimerase
MATTYLVTGGTGFLGSALVKALVRSGARVRTLDNDARGHEHRLGPVLAEVERIQGDIRDPALVQRAVQGVDVVCHLAYINGTEYFYSHPDLILDVAVKGMVNVLDACLAQGVADLVLASSSEVYQTPAVVPTDEAVPLVVPDPLNPRYSYGGGKILSELMALNYGRRHFRRVVVFRPHNVYGPDMGWEHVIPQFAVRMQDLCAATSDATVSFPIQGSGKETRSFIHIDDAIEGILRIIQAGSHLAIYHLGTEEETSMERLASMVGQFFGRQVNIVPGQLQPGGTLRRCPNIARLAALGFQPRIPLSEGLAATLCWYRDNHRSRPAADRRPGSLGPMTVRSKYSGTW